MQLDEEKLAEIRAANVRLEETLSARLADLEKVLRADLDSDRSKSAEELASASHAYEKRLQDAVASFKRLFAELSLQVEQVGAAAASAKAKAAESSEVSASTFSFGGGSISEDSVKKIVLEILAKYDADRTGLPDYALESAGASVIGVRCSEKLAQ